MSNPRYPEEFKIQAVNQVTEKKLPVADVAARLGVSSHSLYAWIKRYSKPQAERQQDDDQHAELRRLRAELKRVTEERDKTMISTRNCGVCEPNSSGSPKSET
ncbi:transposase, partial [Pseudomonas extremaustralis]|uniref:transposase n=1 Tax=Pseudomonas extremaustralis TaxID=359110 RepID=UPI0023DF7E90